MNIDNYKCLWLIWHAGSNLQDSGLLSLFPRSSNTDALGWWSAWKGELEVLTVLQRPYKMRHHLDRVRQRGSVRIWTEKSTQDIKTWFDHVAWSCSTVFWFVNQVFELRSLESLLPGRFTLYPPLSFYETSASSLRCIIVYEAVYSSINVHPWWSDHKGTTHHFTPGIRHLNMSDRTAVMGFHLLVLFE